MWYTILAPEIRFEEVTATDSIVLVIGENRRHTPHPHIIKDGSGRPLKSCLAQNRKPPGPRTGGLDIQQC